MLRQSKSGPSFFLVNTRKLFSWKQQSTLNKFIKDKKDTEDICIFGYILDKQDQSYFNPPLAADIIKKTVHWDLQGPQSSFAP